jgi:hypothetical protein
VELAQQARRATLVQMGQMVLRGRKACLELRVLMVLMVQMR